MYDYSNGVSVDIPGQKKECAISGTDEEHGYPNCADVWGVIQPNGIGSLAHCDPVRSD